MRQQLQARDLIQLNRDAMKKALEEILSYTRRVNYRRDSPDEEQPAVLLGRIQATAEIALGVPYEPAAPAPVR